MEGLISNIAEQVPSLVVLAWLVSVFLKHQRGFADKVQQMSNLYADLTGRCLTTIDRNSNITARLEATVDRLEKSVTICPMSERIDQQEERKR